jgi:hypothetical protein
MECHDITVMGIHLRSTHNFRNVGLPNVYMDKTYINSSCTGICTFSTSNISFVPISKGSEHGFVSHAYLCFKSRPMKADYHNAL